MELILPWNEGKYINENLNINKSLQFLYDSQPPGVLKLFSKILAPQWERTLTQCLLRLTLVGVFEDEEVVSGGISGDPVLELLGLCGFGVHQLNGLFLYIQPLQRKSHPQNFTSKLLIYHLHILISLFIYLSF